MGGGEHELVTPSFCLVANGDGDPEAIRLLWPQEAPHRSPLEWPEVARRKKQRGAKAAAALEPVGEAGPVAGSRRRLRAVPVAAAAVVALLLAGIGFWRGSGRAHPNLLLITLDTLRADHVGVYGAAQAKTPRLDGLAARGARFEHAQTAVPLTGPSHATIFTGQYPPVHGVRDNVVFALGDKHRTLAEMLREKGYRTGAFVALTPWPGPSVSARASTSSTRTSRRAPARARSAGATRWPTTPSPGSTRSRGVPSSPGSTSTTPTRPTSRPSPTRARSRAAPTTARSPSPTSRWAGCSTRSRRRATKATPWWRCWPTTASRWASTAS